MDVHLPYDAPERNRAKFVRPYDGRLATMTIRNARNINKLLPKLTDADRGHVIDSYDAAINEADDTVGAIVADLTRRKLLDETIIIVTADHGEELFEHGDFTHGHSMYREVVSIPLIIRNPGLRKSGVRVKQLVRQVDIFPTVLGFAGVSPPSFIMGRDLGPAIEDPSLDWQLEGFTEGVLHGPMQLALQRGSLKLIKIEPPRRRRERKSLDALRQRPGWVDETGVLEFFDLGPDPGERHPITVHPAKAALAGRLEALRIADSGVALAAAPEKLDKEKIEQLKSLGYVR
jgi:arylsulfatase A-like enzyme